VGITELVVAEANMVANKFCPLLLDNADVGVGVAAEDGADTEGAVAKRE
jgi:uncharacterized membrane protein